MNQKRILKLSLLAATLMAAAVVPAAEATTRAFTDNSIGATEPNACAGGFWDNTNPSVCFALGVADSASSCTSGTGGICLDVVYFPYSTTFTMTNPNAWAIPLHLRYLYPGMASWAGIYGVWEDCNGDSYVDDLSTSNGGLASPNCAGVVDEFVPIGIHDSYDWAANAFTESVYFDVIRPPSFNSLVSCPPYPAFICSLMPRGGPAPDAYFDFCPTGPTQTCGYAGVDSIVLHSIVYFPMGSFLDGATVAAWVGPANTIDSAGQQVSVVEPWSGYLTAVTLDVDSYNP